MSDELSRPLTCFTRISTRADITGRERHVYLLRLIFGDTFAETAYFYKNPNAKAFIARLLHVASGGRVSVDADTSRIFVRAPGGNAYRVDENELVRLGCPKAALFETLRRTLGADSKLRHPDAAPLIISAPGEAADDQVPPMVMPPSFFDEDAMRLQDLDRDFDVDLDFDLDNHLNFGLDLLL